MLISQTLPLATRFKQALRDINHQGIVAKRNVMKCCRSCVNLDISEQTPLIWHFGGQGHRLVLDDDYSSEDTVYFNHQNIIDKETDELNDAGKRIVATFERYGFTLEAEPSAYKVLEIRLQAKTGETN